MDEIERIAEERFVEAMICLWIQPDAPEWIINYVRQELRKQRGLLEEKVERKGSNNNARKGREVEMTDGCHNCRFRLRLEKLDYRRGCKHERMKGFICTAMADEGVANWMLGLDDDDSKCECWEKRKEDI